VALAGANAGDFVQTNTCPATLAAGASCTASVTFTPTATGARAASLSFTDDASGTPHTVALSGTGAAAATALASASPSQVLFGDQPVSTHSAQRTVTLTNTGTLPMSISGITIVGANASDFAPTTTCPTGAATLAVGSSCTIDVTMTPASTGSRAATLSVAGNAANSPANVALAGTGTLPPGTLFMDGFDGGLAAWQVGNCCGALVQAGPGGVSFSHAGSGPYIYADFPGQGQPRTHTRFKLSPGNQFQSELAQGRDATGANVWEIDHDPRLSRLDVYVWNGAHVRKDFYVSSPFTGGSPYSVDVDLDQSVAGHFALSINGVTVASANGDFSTANNYTRLFFLDMSDYGTVTFDDVSVKTS
jgi:hypothetical protein